MKHPPIRTRLSHPQPLAGLDGVLGTAADRALVVGGGDSVFMYGGEPVETSCEVYVQP